MDLGVALVQLNRPKKRNAFSQSVINELTEALGQLDRSPTVMAVVLTSSGPFCGKPANSAQRVLQADKPFNSRS